jgi:hypothetical protein
VTHSPRSFPNPTPSRSRRQRRDSTVAITVSILKLMGKQNTVDNLRNKGQTKHENDQEQEK